MKLKGKQRNEKGKQRNEKAILHFLKRGGFVMLWRSLAWGEQEVIVLRSVFGFLWLILSWKQGQKIGKLASPDHPGLVATEVVGQRPIITGGLVIVHLYR